MKVISLLDMMAEYQRVTITPCTDLEWNGDNPYIIQPVKIRELSWHFVRSIGEREVVEIRSSLDSNVNGDERSYLSIDYK